MKVTLNNQEIQEAVQCYISNILGSDLKVTEISVVQGREQGGSNTSRIELELVKNSSIKEESVKQSSVVPANVISGASSAVNSLNIPVEDDEEETPFDVTEPDSVPVQDEPKAETAKPLSEPVVEQTVNASFFNRAN